MIPFNKPYMTGKVLGYISQAHHREKGHMESHIKLEFHYTWSSSVNQQIKNATEKGQLVLLLGRSVKNIIRQAWK